MITHEHVLRAIRGETWAMLPDHLERAMVVAMARVHGGPADLAAVARNVETNAVQAARAAGVASSSTNSVAVIPVFGTMLQRSQISLSGPGACSTEGVGRQIRAAADDPNVRAIVLDIDSPGGSVAGIPELFDVVYAARSKKEIVAVSDSLCASAAYWLAAACTTRWASPSSLTGSVGVYCVHEDMSGALEKAGVKVTFVQYGSNKTLGNNAEPLDDAAYQNMLARVTSYGKDFEKDIAQGLGVTVSKIHADFGQGNVFRAKEAKSIGMVDKVGTLDDVLAKYGVSRYGTGAAASAFAFAAAADSLPSAASGAPVAEDTEACPRGDDCPAQAEDIDDSAECPASDCPLRDGGSDARAQACAAHAHRQRQLDLASV